MGDRGWSRVWRLTGSGPDRASRGRTSESVGGRYVWGVPSAPRVVALLAESGTGSGPATEDGLASGGEGSRPGLESKCA